MRHGPWIAALALLLGARPADANRVQLGLRYDHAVDMARSEWAPRYWQGLTLAGQLRFLRLAKVGCQVGVLAPVVAGERSDAEAPVLSDTRVLGGVVIPTGARWVVPEVGFALVAPTSAFSRRSGLVLGLAPRARVTLRAGDRVRLGAGFAGLHYLRQRPRTDGWTDEVNAFIEVEGSVGPGMLYNYLQSTDRLTRWHLDPWVESVVRVGAGFSIAVAVHLFADQRYRVLISQGKLFGDGFDSPIPSGAQVRNLDGQSDWNFVPYVVGEVRYHVAPWLVVSTGVSYRTGETAVALYWASGPAPPVWHNEPDTRLFMTAAFNLAASR